VIANEAFNFSTTYLTSTTAFYNATVGSEKTIVMEWAITRNNTCEEAKVGKNTPYACVSNDSHCITNDAGYACKCSGGYEGNPYIVNGCTGSSSCPLFFFIFLAHEDIVVIWHISSF
jgi:hypothetical protein